jgi:hypothetical protein
MHFDNSWYRWAAETTIDNGGGTFTPGSHKQPCDGWVYGLAGGAKVAITGNRDKDIVRVTDQMASFLARFPRHLQHPYYLGLWVDGRCVFIDIVVRTYSQEYANKMAAKNGQRAIFNLATCQTTEVVSLEDRYARLLEAHKAVSERLAEVEEQLHKARGLRNDNPI